MKISSKLPQFIDKVALIIVVSKQNGKIFEASNENINLIKEIEIEKPRFIDKAGMFFKRKGRGRPVGASAYKENLKENTKDELLKKFKDMLNEIIDNHPEKFDFVYLFASPYVIGDISSMLEDDFKINPRKVIEGNFIKQHPFKLLEKIEKE